MLKSDYDIFLSVKSSLCQIRQLKTHKFLPYCGWQTWQTTHCPLINHHLKFTTCVTSPARKRHATDYNYYWQAVVGGCCEVFRRPRCGVACCPLWHTTRDETIVAPDAHWSFPSLPNARPLPSWAIIGLISSSLTSALENPKRYKAILAFFVHTFEQDARVCSFALSYSLCTIMLVLVDVVHASHVSLMLGAGRVMYSVFIRASCVWKQGWWQLRLKSNLNVATMLQRAEHDFKP